MILFFCSCINYSIFGLIIAIMGAALAINGISGYHQSKWAGFFLMVFGTILCLGNLMML